ncbi:MAG: peroxidase-related enzyme [Acidimicrobiia bacterium]|nr:peroxidase-related enzyme [Acidimicrobiia bacterium]
MSDATPGNGPRISRFPVPELEDLPEDLRARIEEVAAKSGFIPNVFLVLAHRPDEFRAFFAYHDAVMERPSGLTKGEKELVVVATSAANDCQYCVVAHGAVARIRMKDPRIADQVATNWRKADLTDRQRALLAFAVKVATRSGELEEADYADMHRHGWSDEDIWDVGAIAGLFALSNRMANVTGMRPNDEFYALGR